MPGQGFCRHCHKATISRPRRLCFVCYREVKHLYPPDCKYGRRGVGNGNKLTRLPDTISDAEPGSAAKLAILADRAANGVSLFHPAEPVFVPESAALETPVCTVDSEYQPYLDERTLWPDEFSNTPIGEDDRKVWLFHRRGRYAN